MKQNIGDIYLVNNSGVQRYGMFLGEEEDIFAFFIFDKGDWYYRLYEREKLDIKVLEYWRVKELLSTYPLHSSLTRILYQRKRKIF